MKGKKAKEIYVLVTCCCAGKGVLKEWS